MTADAQMARVELALSLSENRTFLSDEFDQEGVERPQSPFALDFGLASLQ